MTEEWLDEVDETGTPTGRSVERREAHQKGIRHRTSHVWLVRKKGGTVEVLLQKRSRTKSSFPGMYDISSAGHIPAGDTYVPSALRELSEELGVLAQEQQLVYCGDRVICTDAVFFGEPFHDRQVSRVFLLWEDREEEAFRLQPEEVDEVRWMELDECIRQVRENAFPNCIVPEELMMVRQTIGRDSHADS